MGVVLALVNSLIYTMKKCPKCDKKTLVEQPNEYFKGDYRTYKVIDAHVYCDSCNFFSYETDDTWIDLKIDEIMYERMVEDA